MPLKIYTVDEMQKLLAKHFKKLTTKRITETLGIDARTFRLYVFDGRLVPKNDPKKDRLIKLKLIALTATIDYLLEEEDA